MNFFPPALPVAATFADLVYFWTKGHICAPSHVLSQQGAEAFNESSFTTLGYPNKAYRRITEIRGSEAGHLRVFQDRCDMWVCSVNIHLCN
jgi:hypothetical protein